MKVVIKSCERESSKTVVSKDKDGAERKETVSVFVAVAEMGGCEASGKGASKAEAEAAAAKAATAAFAKKA